MNLLHTDAKDAMKRRGTSEWHNRRCHKKQKPVS